MPSEIDAAIAADAVAVGAVVAVLQKMYCFGTQRRMGAEVPLRSVAVGSFEVDEVAEIAFVAPIE